MSIAERLARIEHELHAIHQEITHTDRQALLERITELEEALGQSDHIPFSFALTPNQDRILRLLLARTIVSVESIAIMVGRHADCVNPNAVSVAIVNLRPKLATYGVGIYNRQREGYYITPEHKAKLRTAALRSTRN